MSRMATLAPEGRIRVHEVEEEIQRLSLQWRGNDEERSAAKAVTAGAHLLTRALTKKDLAKLDTFERMQLESVLETCSKCNSLAEAGRALFDVSRLRRKSQNDADRVRKYLGRYGLSLEQPMHCYLKLSRGIRKNRITSSITVTKW